MKRIICIFICVFMLCGCGGSKIKVTPITKGISFTASINYYNEYFLCDAQIDKNGDMKICVAEPNDISGMKLYFSKDTVTAEYMGITYTPKSGALPIGNVAGTIRSILSGIDSETPIIADKGENALLEGRNNDRAYKIHFSPSGFPISLEIPDDSFKIEFNKVEVT